MCHIVLNLIIFNREIVINKVIIISTIAYYSCYTSTGYNYSNTLTTRVVGFLEAIQQFIFLYLVTYKSTV